MAGHQPRHFNFCPSLQKVRKQLLHCWYRVNSLLHCGLRVYLQYGWRLKNSYATPPGNHTTLCQLWYCTLALANNVSTTTKTPVVKAQWNGNRTIHWLDIQWLELARPGQYKLVHFRINPRKSQFRQSFFLTIDVHVVKLLYTPARHCRPGKVHTCPCMSLRAYGGIR